MGLTGQSMKARKPRVAVLLGAGSSIPAGFPSTEDLTCRILSGTGTSRPTDGTFYVDSCGDVIPSAHVMLVAKVSALYRNEIEDFFQQRYGRPANYEDIYCLASQLADHEEGELDNPGLCRLIDHLRPEFTELIEGAAIPDVETIHELARETTNYIFDTVWRSLVIAPSQITHLKPIEVLCRSTRFERVAIATLCHDTHVDDFLKCRGIIAVDGFSSANAGVRYWSPKMLCEESNQPLLLKLHGSTNWFRLRPDKGTWYDERIGIADNGDYYHTRDSHGRLQLPVSSRPLFLVGTFNKIADYSQELFSELLYCFRAFLASVDRVAVCGYSFGDKGVNAALINWLYGCHDRQLIVIHRDPDRVRATARGAIAHKWDKWEQSGCLRIIEKWIQDLDEDALEACLAG